MPKQDKKQSTGKGPNLSIESPTDKGDRDDPGDDDWDVVVKGSINRGVVVDLRVGSVRPPIAI